MIVLVIIGTFSILIFIAVFFGGNKNSMPPNVTVGHNGIESHNDFLEMHGFITAEEREANRKMQQEYEQHPERFKTMNLKEFLDDQNRGS